MMGNLKYIPFQGETGLVACFLQEHSWEPIALASIHSLEAPPPPKKKSRDTFTQCPLDEWGQNGPVGCAVMVEIFCESPLEREFLTLKGIMLKERSQS